jgi:hypothetical protein
MLSSRGLRRVRIRTVSADRAATDYFAATGKVRQRDTALAGIAPALRISPAVSLSVVVPL